MTKSQISKAHFYRAMMRMRPAQRPVAWVKNWARETQRVLSAPYVPGPSSQVSLPSGRVLDVPGATDRLIQGAVQLALSDLSRESGVQTKGVKSILEVISRRLETLNEAHIFRGDIKNFYGNIQVGRVLPIITERTGLKDTWILSAIGAVFRQQRGIPQGSPLSSWLAEQTLIPLDAILAQNHGMRYADDLLIIAKDAKTLSKARGEVEENLGSLGLDLNQKKVTELVYPKEEFSFLGKTFQHNQQVPAVLKVKAGSEGLGFKPFKGEKQTSITVQETSDARTQTPYGLILSKNHLLKTIAEKPNLESVMVLSAQKVISTSPQGEKLIKTRNQFLHKGIGKSLHDAAFKLYVGSVKPKQHAAEPNTAAKVVMILIIGNSIMKEGKFPENYLPHQQEYQEAMAGLLSHDYERYRKVVSKLFKENYVLRQSNTLPEQSEYEQLMTNNEIDLLDVQ